MSEKLMEKLVAVLERVEKKLDGAFTTKGITIDQKFDDVDPDRPTRSLVKALMPVKSDDEELLFRRFRDRLMRDPIVLKVLATEKRIEVVTETQVVELEGASVKGRIALLLKDGFLDEGKTVNQVWGELRRRGYPSKSNGAPPAVYDFMVELAADGFCSVDGKAYRAVDGAGRRLKVKE